MGLIPHWRVTRKGGRCSVVGVAPKFRCVVVRSKPGGKLESAQMGRARGIFSLPISSSIPPPWTHMPMGQARGHWVLPDVV